MGSLTSQDIVWLEGLDAVRKRPGMYIGDASQGGADHCVFEVIDNAVDEALDGHCSTVTVTRHTDGSWSVCDDGRGIPPEAEQRSGLSGMILVMTRLHAGSKFGGSSNTASGGLHGVGVSAVNAVSGRLDLVVLRGKTAWHASFKQGVAGRFSEDGPNAEFTACDNPNDALLKRRSSSGLPPQLNGRSGTCVRFWLDPDIFTDGSEPCWDTISERCRITSHVAGVRFDLRDERNGSQETVDGQGGLASLVDSDLDDMRLGGPWSGQASCSYEASTQKVGPDGGLIRATEHRSAHAEVSVGWDLRGLDAEGGTRIGGYVNAIHTPAGGTHVAAAESALASMLGSAYRGTRILSSKEDPPSREDMRHGMSLKVSVRVPEPEFAGQTKNSLATKEIRPAVAEAVDNALRRAIGGSRLSAEGRAVLSHIADVSRRRLAARELRAADRKKSAAQKHLPAKLRDCRRHGAGSELFIVEGDSAAGSVAGARDSEFQAFLPLRGKILNCMKSTVKQMMDNNECCDLVSAIGAGVGTDFDIDKARYHDVYLLVDADVDGSHIRCLVLSFFWRYMPELLTEGRVWAAEPPLYMVRRGDDIVYAYSDEERDAVLSDWGGGDVQRFKGLGEMNPDELAHTAVDPATRRTTQLTVSDAAAADAMFGRLMGSDAAVRKSWLLGRMSEPRAD